jgi:hypothetical protein
MSRAALQPDLRPECFDRSFSLCRFQFAQEWEDRIEDLLHESVSFDDPLEVVNVPMALNSSDATKRALQALKNLRNGLCLSMLCS